MSPSEMRTITGQRPTNAGRIIGVTSVWNLDYMLDRESGAEIISSALKDAKARMLGAYGTVRELIGDATPICNSHRVVTIIRGPDGRVYCVAPNGPDGPENYR